MAWRVDSGENRRGHRKNAEQLLAELSALVHNHEEIVCGQRVLFLPRADSKQLLIVFNVIGSTEYPRLWGFASDQRVNLFFVSDATDRFYSCQGRGALYQKILSGFAKKFEPCDITTFGISMGANGAIYHGLKLGANVYAVNPIVDWSASYRHTTYPPLKKRLKEIGKEKFVNLHPLFKSAMMRSVVCCQFNNDDMGLANAAILSESLPQYGSLILEIVNSPWHTAVNDGITPEAVYNRMAVLSRFREIRAPALSIRQKGEKLKIRKRKL